MCHSPTWAGDAYRIHRPSVSFGGGPKLWSRHYADRAPVSLLLEECGLLSCPEVVSMALEIRIDRDVCMGSGNCAFWAPTVFDLDDEGVAYVLANDESMMEKINAAVQGCPTQAISLTS